MPRAGVGRERSAAPAESQEHDQRWAWLRAAGPAVVSVVAHLVVLLALAMMIVARDAKPDRFVIISGAPAEEVVEDSVPVEFDADIAPTQETEQAEATPAEMPSLDVAPTLPEPIALDSLAAVETAPPIDPAGTMPAADEVMATFGGGGDAAAGTGRAGGGGGGPAGRGGGAPTFFGKTGQGQSVCFICDNSPSYKDGGFHMVLSEVARAVDALKPEQSFFVIFYSDAAYPMFHPDKIDALQPATPQNKQRLQTWLATVELCSGGVRGLRDAVKIATGLGVDVVYFLSDGRDFEAQKRCMLSTDFGATVVHTFGMQQNLIDKRTRMLDPKKVSDQQGYNQNLIDIAAAHDGEFTPVQVPPEAAAMEQVRPIRKNFSRGPVWGTRLDAEPGN